MRHLKVKVPPVGMIKHHFRRCGQDGGVLDKLAAAGLVRWIWHDGVVASWNRFASGIATRNAFANARWFP